MLSAKMLGHGASKWCFVIFCIFKPDAKGLDWAPALGLHQSDDDGRIDAAGEECADRNIGHHLHRDRLMEQLCESIGGRHNVSVKGLRQTVLDRGPQGPILPGL